MIKLVIFDFDGVFADSFETVYNAYNHMLQTIGMKEFQSIELFKDAYSVDWRNNYKSIGIPEKFTEQASELIKEYFIENADDIRLFDNMINTAMNIDCKKAIATSGHKKYVRKKLENTGFLEEISVIIDADDITNLKPHPEPLLKCMEYLDIGPKETMYVGDTVIDIIAGRNANVAKVIAVPWGFDDEQELKNAGPDGILKIPDDLRKYL